MKVSLCVNDVVSLLPLTSSVRTHFPVAFAYNTAVLHSDTVRGLLL